MTNPEWRRELASLEGLADDWDGEGAPAPNADSIAWATDVTSWALSLGEIEIEVSPDVLGGVGVWLVKGGREASLGRHNDEYFATFVLSDGHQIAGHGRLDDNGRSDVARFLAEG